MARQSPNRPEADEPAADEPVADAPEASTTASTTVDVTEVDDVAADDVIAEPVTSGSGGGRALWDKARIEPIEIALPGGVGFTLRAYRLASELTPTEIDDTAEEDPFDARERAAAARRAEDEDEVIVDDEFAALLAEGEADPKDGKGKVADGEIEEPDPADFEDEPEPDTADEEVPIFLSHRGRLLLFKSPESLVSFIRSGAPHDLAQLDSWTTVAERVQAADIAPQDEDSYELDLVVENLRGGHDTWDLPLLIEAGEVARDLGYALRLKPVIMALNAGSPLDDLDNSLRSASDGGMGGFFGKRRLRKIGAQQASLGWRSIIGKISAAVDWRD